MAEKMVVEDEARVDSARMAEAVWGSSKAVTKGDVYAASLL